MSEKAEWICTIADAKHTTAVGGNIPGGEQKKLYKAAINVNSAIANMGHGLKDIRLIFLTNKSGLGDSNVTGLNEAKECVKQLWPQNEKLELELVNHETFDCGPFSDVLMAQRHQRKKRKVEERI